MIFIFRVIAIAIIGLGICIFGTLYSLLSPRNPRNTAKVARYFSLLAPVIGVKVIMREPAGHQNPEKCVYIANHQNNYDLVVAGQFVKPNTVTIGKKSLVWVPFFGIMYWLTGNILIDRSNKSKAHGTISQVVSRIRERGLSVWMFPEGTRSRGRGLLPFKTGAFHVAVEAGIPIVPICVSNTTRGKINLNRWNNGYVIFEMLPPIDTTGYSKENVRQFAQDCHTMMQEKIAQLDAEVAELEKKQKA